MRIITDLLPKTGDYTAYQTRILSDAFELELSLTGKLSGTELQIAIVNKKIKNEEDALVQFKASVENSALELFNRKAYKKGQEFIKNFSIP